MSHSYNKVEIETFLKNWNIEMLRSIKGEMDSNLL